MKKNILISGSNTGIGYETSKFFLKKGWKVFGHYFENNKKIKILIKNKNFISIKADFSSEKDISKKAKKTVKSPKKLKKIRKK